MFEGLYSNISQKYPHKFVKRKNIVDGESTLVDFLVVEKEYNQIQIFSAFIQNLKELLIEDNALSLIEKISLLDGTLKKIQEIFQDEEIPHLSDFYQDLSPVLMQKYWEINQSTSDKETLDLFFLHSLHISLEEEIYIWQEKLIKITESPS